ncbi:S9 family peptidase [Paraburkholderia kururiensis]|uniref:S9 family peptidase n=1 Tax=Paraburkholderia kururiensis TaxID=984307 RepID=UPI00037D2AED|nr:S9 family peptidase [Paraburkholderia kururiensis]
MNLWVCKCSTDVGDALASARAITADSNRGIYSFWWAFDGQYLLYAQDKNGDENQHIFAVPVAGGEARDLTPFPGARASLQALSKNFPGSALVNINQRDPRFADLYRIELDTGELTLLQENDGLHGFITGEDFKAHFAVAPEADGGALIKVADGASWKPWLRISTEDVSNTWPQGMSADGRWLYMLDSRGRDTAALVRFDLAAGPASAELIAEHPRADINGVWVDVNTKEPLAWTATYERREIHVLDEVLRKDVDFLEQKNLGQWGIASRTQDNQTWILVSMSDVSPASYYLYDRANAVVQKLYDCRPALAGAPLARMQSMTLTARDGLDLVCYLTLPVFADVADIPLKSTAPLPLVLHVHGGPQARDFWGYDPNHQWLANRGYAVLSVNFRASTGFGKSFIKAGDGQWGARMDDDLVDAVHWAIDHGIADPERVCIMGASYGGYATLWGMTAHADLYACGVDIVGPANLETLAESIPPYWEAAKTQLYRMIGDAGTAEGRSLMKARSPVYYAASIQKPLLIGQGANDPRVKQAESDQMVAALKASNVPVSYVLFPDEGHGFYRPANQIKFNAITEQFLAKFLGGRFEPVLDSEVHGNTAIIVEDSFQ